jgi:hypothetical protein
MNLANALSKNADPLKLRTRAFEMNGHTFKVRVPLATELEQMFERINTPVQEQVEKYYAELSQPFTSDKVDETIVERTDDDILVSGRSLREAAKAKAITEQRILEMIRLLVPEEQGFDMASVNYDMVQEAFPFAIQLEMMELISKTISPDYKEHRGK